VDPSVDFGGLVRRVPSSVHAPTSVDELAACMRELRVPFKLRGAAHSASGEVLTDHAVIDLSRLAGVIADGEDEITALGGTTWLALWEHLAARGRRPLTLTDNPRVTLAGTLAVGGVGDASHLFGPQLAGVRRLVLVTPDGARHSLAPGAPLFDHTLAAHGQLGAIAEVTLTTRRAPSTIHARLARWGALDAYLEDAAATTGDFLRGRVVWHEGMVRAWAIVGDSQAAPAPPRHAITTTDAELLDVLAQMRPDPSALYRPFNPCLELVLPFPDGLVALRRIDTQLARGDLVRHLPRGSSLQLVRGTNLPLSPFRAERCIVLALRPEPPTLADAHACEAPLRALADEALASGGRVYLASFQLAPDALAAQLGDAARTLAELKRAVDPDLRCNRGSLHGWVCTSA
jgi:FAD/FMN-containing dehydrogenase